MYTDKSNFHPSANAGANAVSSRLSSAPHDHNQLPGEPPPYSRTASSDASASVMTTTTDATSRSAVSATGQAAIAASRQALVDSAKKSTGPTGTRCEPSHLRLLVNHFNNIVRHRSETDRKEVLKLVDFLEGEYGFTPSQRLRALKESQTYFNFPLSGQDHMETLFRSLRKQTTSQHHDFFNLSKSLRAAIPSKFWNDDALQQLQNATVRYIEKNGDNLRKMNPGHASIFFQTLLRDHMEGVSTHDRHSLEVLLTKKPGYLEEILGEDRYEVLYDPDAPVSGEAESVPFDSSLQPYRTSDDSIDIASPIEQSRRSPLSPSPNAMDDDHGFPDLEVFAYEVDDHSTTTPMLLGKDLSLHSTAAMSTPSSSPVSFSQTRLVDFRRSDSTFASSTRKADQPLSSIAQQSAGFYPLHRQESPDFLPDGAHGLWPLVGGSSMQDLSGRSDHPDAQSMQDEQTQMSPFSTWLAEFLEQPKP